MKLGKGIRLYAIVTQYMLLTFMLVVLGVYVGSKMNLKYEVEFWDGALGILGMFVGLFSFVYFILKYGGKRGK